MKELEDKIKAFCDSKSIDGPFKGMHIDPVDQYGPGHVILKWLGTFEQPIHSYVNNELNKQHDAFINIGCGDGYYGVGVKLRSPATDIFLVDIDPACVEEVKKTCSANSVSEYAFLSDFPQKAFQETLAKYINPWVFVDIEGAEVDVLDPVQVSNLSKATITVEMHDCFRMGVTNELIARFQKTHDIVNIVDDWQKTIPPLPEDIQLSQEVLDFIKYERRCTRMNWLHMVPKN